MNKKILSFIISLLVLLSISTIAFAEGETSSVLPHFVDNAGLCDSYEASELSSKLLYKSEELQFDIVVVTVNDCEGKTATEYADDYYDYNGYGYGENHDGCLLLVDMSDRYMWLSTTGYGITAITDYGIQYIIDDLTANMHTGNYYDAFNQFAELVSDFVNESRTEQPYDTNHKLRQPAHFSAKNLFIALIAAVIISLIVISMIKKSYKPVRFKSNASDYLVNGSLVLNSSVDDFLYSSVSKTKIESDSGGGGSSTHSGSSGTSHGGGGGHF